jgi:hypothetical protein
MGTIRLKMRAETNPKDKERFDFFRQTHTGVKKPAGAHPSDIAQARRKCRRTSHERAGSRFLWMIIKNVVPSPPLLSMVPSS